MPKKKVGKPAAPVPQRRHVRAGAIDGIPASSRVTNQRPGHRYHIVNRADAETCAQMRYDGYWPIRWTFQRGGDVTDDEGFALDEYGSRIPENPHFMSGLLGDEKEGDYVEAVGNILYETTEERWREIQQYGANGGGGQEEADRIEKMIMRHTGFSDPMRGIHPAQARVGSHSHGSQEGYKDMDWPEEQT